MKFNIGDKVKEKNSKKSHIGTIVGIFDEDEYYRNATGEEILFASKGEYKVRFNSDIESASIPFPEEGIERA